MLQLYNNNDNSIKIYKYGQITNLLLEYFIVDMFKLNDLKNNNLVIITTNLNKIKE